MVSSVNSNPPGNFVLSGLETAGQMGLSLGLSRLVRVPFTTNKAKVLAGIIGGGIPMLFRDGHRWFASSEQEKSDAAQETALNFLELGVGIFTSLAPSLRSIFLVNAICGFGFEYSRQRLVSGQAAEHALGSAAITSVGVIAVGGFFNIIPPLRRSLALLQQRSPAAREVRVSVSIEGGLDLTRKEGLAAVSLLGKLTANVARVAKQGKIPDPTVEIRQVGYDLEIAYNIGGFWNPAQRVATDQGWEVVRSSNASGTRVLISFGKRNNLPAAYYIKSPDGSYAISGEEQSVVVLGDVCAERALELAKRHKVEWIDYDDGLKELIDDHAAQRSLGLTTTTADWYDVSRRADFLESFYPLTPGQVPWVAERRVVFCDEFVRRVFVAKLRRGGIGYFVTEYEDVFNGLSEAIERHPSLRVLESVRSGVVPIVGGYDSRMLLDSVPARNPGRLRSYLFFRKT